MGIDVHFSQTDWRRIERDWSDWWLGKLDRPMAMLEGPRPGDHPPAAPEPRRTNAYMLQSDPEAFLDVVHRQLETRGWYGDAFPKHWLNFGPGMGAGFLGCGVHFDDNTTWFGPPVDGGLDAIHIRFDKENPWWKRVKTLTRRAVERWGGKVAIAHTDLGGNLDILASFRGNEPLMMDLIDAPQEIERLAGEITAVWLRYYDELDAIIRPTGRGTCPWAPIWSPQRCYMLQCDASYMFSPAMFERFVLPDLTACCDHLEHGFYHLDGVGQLPHLDLLLAMPKLRGVQWIPGDGHPHADGWPQVLRKIVDAGKRCQVFTTSDGARRIVREVGGRGMAIHVWGWHRRDDALRLLEDLGAAPVVGGESR
ncbi:MAG: hypothetical protein IT441_07845 [Phycisphaeraceae bacterium]|nr:hypothetical protein [Phycisphaeraceae bacterium]